MGERPFVPRESIVVLVAPEALEPGDRAWLLKTMSSRPDVRVLVRGLKAEDVVFAGDLAGQGQRVELLMAADLASEGAAMRAVRMPEGSSESELNDLALALADVLIASSAAGKTAGSPAHRLLAAAAAVQKPVCPPGCTLTRFGAPARSISHSLDPEQAGWHSALRGWFGRCEQLALESLAWHWDRETAPKADRSRKRLRQCFRRGWRPQAYFAPDRWVDAVPDRAAAADSAPIVAAFDRLDRSALFGAYAHRDAIWLTYSAAAAAVMLAVAGAMAAGVAERAFHQHTRLAWQAVAKTGGWLEFLLLLITAAIVLITRSLRVQDRWTACRTGAEQLRIARMCLPLLIVPPGLNAGLRQPRVATRSGAELMLQALEEVRRATRDQGLPLLAPDYTVVDAAHWLHLVVADQCLYHQENHVKLECAERRLDRATNAVFVLAFAAVAVNLVHEIGPLLLATAGLPAVAAAAHGIQARLGIAHRAGLSEDVEAVLVPIEAELAAFMGGEPGRELTWRRVREMAQAAADAMGRENTAWHGLLRRGKEVLP